MTWLYINDMLGLSGKICTNMSSYLCTVVIAGVSTTASVRRFV